MYERAVLSLAITSGRKEGDMNDQGHGLSGWMKGGEKSEENRA